MQFENDATVLSCLQDNGEPTQSTLVNVVIEVTDMQDQGPRFTNAPLTVTVQEHAPRVSGLSSRTNHRRGNKTGVSFENGLKDTVKEKLKNVSCSLQGTAVGTLSAQDQDTGNPNPIRMAVVEGTPAQSLETPVCFCKSMTDKSVLHPVF